MPFTLPSDFDTARETWDSRYRLEHDLPPECAHEIYLHRYHVNGAHWGHGRLNPYAARGSAHPTLPGFYCVVPDKFERQEGPLVFFTRIYANIPRSWEQISSAIVTVPGFDQAPTYAAGQTIAAVAIREFGSIFRLTKSSHGYSAGDNVHVLLTLEVPSYRSAGLGAVSKGTARQSWNQSTTIRAVTTDTFDVALSPYNLSLPAFAATIIDGSVRRITSGYEKRPAATRLVTTSIVRDYYIVGVSPGVPVRSAIPLHQPFRIEQGTTDDADFQDNVLTSTTVPTAAQFRALIDANALLPLDCVLEEYLSTITCRKTTFYPAT